MTSFVSICNLALTKLGHDEPITNLSTDTTKAARLMNQSYVQVRKELLRSHPWNFAKERVVLAADTAEPAFGGGAYFTLPSDWIRTIFVNETYTDHDSENGKILSAGDTLNLVYIKDITDPTKFDPLFIAAYSSKLAWFNAYSITQSLSAQQAMEAMFKADIAAARHANAIDRGLQRFNAEQFIASR